MAIFALLLNQPPLHGGRVLKVACLTQMFVSNLLISGGCSSVFEEDDCVALSSVDFELALQSQSERTESSTARALELRCWWYGSFCCVALFTGSGKALASRCFQQPSCRSWGQAAPERSFLSCRFELDWSDWVAAYKPLNISVLCSLPISVLCS